MERGGVCRAFQGSVLQWKCSHDNMGVLSSLQVDYGECEDVFKMEDRSNSLLPKDGDFGIRHLVSVEMSWPCNFSSFIK